MKQRLSKVLSGAGVASRRAAEKLIFEGRVKVNGKVTLVPQTMVSFDDDLIDVDGKRLRSSEKKVYFLLNKPEGYLCSHVPFTPNSKLVVDLFADLPYRLFTVGRLDRETTGLLIVTNDGKLANKLMHPRFGFEKEYLAKVFEEVMPEHLEMISKGAFVEGKKVVPHSVRKIRRGTLKIVVGEGRKREVRILLQNAGLEVLELSRIRLGPIQLGTLPLGAYREMTSKELEGLIEQ